jgi:DNA-binding NarL/FixJ family response regulator
MSTAKGKIEVLLTDDFHCCRAFFAEGLRQQPDLLVSEARNAVEALRKAEDIRPDVIMLNIAMRQCSGISLLQFIHRQFPEIGVLAFSCAHHDRLYAERAVYAGAAGYIAADESPKNLLAAVQTVAAGGVYLSRRLRRKLSVKSGVCGGVSPVDRLSHREFEVFCLTGHGYVPKWIADKMKVSVKTVETYRERIREKLGLAGGGELLYHAAGFIREQSLPQLQ